MVPVAEFDGAAYPLIWIHEASLTVSGRLWPEVIGDHASGCAETVPWVKHRRSAVIGGEPGW
jgi:hypothetical protein